ncbi:MAG: hypothetical protein WC934_06900 [Acidithiobacillus sp.]|jgi:hypothetical protein|uniref:hypothetical protein n=1 Tax=Acidithiobacillus sp. TaxID=1872118 RepID=UPI00355DAB5F
MDIKKYKLDLSQYKEVPLNYTFKELFTEINNVKKKEMNYKKKQLEAYRRVSINCINNKVFGNSKEKISEGLSQKILLVAFTSIITYYGIFQITFQYLQNNLSNFSYHFFLFLICTVFIALLLIFIWKKDFGNTQFMLFTIVYSFLSILGVSAILIGFLPITSYNILNTFVIILIFQCIIFILITPITKMTVCNINIPY